MNIKDVKVGSVIEFKRYNYLLVFLYILNIKNKKVKYVLFNIFLSDRHKIVKIGEDMIREFKLDDYELSTKSKLFSEIFGGL